MEEYISDLYYILLSFYRKKWEKKKNVSFWMDIAIEISVVSPYLNWEKYSATSAYLRALLDASREIISRRGDWAGAVARARHNTVRLQKFQCLCTFLSVPSIPFVKVKLSVGHIPDTINRLSNFKFRKWELTWFVAFKS